MDQIIDAKCKDRFTEAEIESFYGGFKGKVDEYARINQDTFDTLNSFINFNVFKRDMLKYKEDKSKIASSTEKSEKDKVVIKTYSKDEFYELMKEDKEDPKLFWRQKLDMKAKKEGDFSMKMWSRPMKDSDLLLNRSESCLPNTKMAAMEKMMNDHSRYKESKEILEFKIISEEKEEGKW